MSTRWLIYQSRPQVIYHDYSFYELAAKISPQSYDVSDWLQTKQYSVNNNDVMYILNDENPNQWDVHSYVEIADRNWTWHYWILCPDNIITVLYAGLIKVYWK